MRIPAILIGHSHFAQGMLGALQAIVGEVPDLVPVSTENKARCEIEQVIIAVRDQFACLASAKQPLGRNSLVVFTDLQGGCSGAICGRLLKDCADVVIISGTNLPMLVKYVHYRESLPLEELCWLLVEAGKDGIRALKQPAQP